MSGDLIPLLWLCGPPGVGRTTIGWEIFSRLTQAGIPAGYVDIDQLGICYPEPGSDPGRHRMKATSLGAVVASFRDAGARCVIVSGVVDAGHGVHRDQLPHAALTVCRLRTSREELVERFVGRGADARDVEGALREADDMDATDFADVCIDTSGVPVAEVARRVRDGTGGWPVLPDPSRSFDVVEPDGEVATAVAGPILWLCGATGVGKSAAGWELYLTAMRAGLVAAYIDLDQIGFHSPTPADDPGGHRAKIRNLAAVWQTYREAGAQCLVVVGPVEDEATVRSYTAVLPAATVTLCRLHAGRDQLTRQIMLRGQGRSWSQPGDRLKGQSPAHLLHIVEQAVADAESLERAAIGDLRIDTDQRTVEEIAQVIVAETGWPQQAEQGAPAPGRSGSMD